MGAVALTGVLALAIPYVQPIAHVFSFNPLPLAEVGVILLLTVVCLLVLDVVKVVYYKVVESPRSPGWLSQRTCAPVTP